MADDDPDQASRWAERAAAAELVGGGLEFIASALRAVPVGSEAAAAAQTARRTLLPLLPLVGGDDHDSSAECRSCPVCRLLAVARLVSPESVDLLGDALDAVMVALRDELGGGGAAAGPVHS